MYSWSSSGVPTSTQGVGCPAMAALTRIPPWPASLSILRTVPQARAGELLVLERWARMRSLSPCGASASPASAACWFERWPSFEEIRRFSRADTGGCDDTDAALADEGPHTRGVVGVPVGQEHGSYIVQTSADAAEETLD